MSEEQTTTNEPTETAETTEQRVYTAADVDRKMNNFIQQIKERDAKLKEFEAQQMTVAQQKAAEEEARKIANNEHLKVIEELKNNDAEKNKVIDELKRQNTETKLIHLLSQEKVDDEFAQIGIVTKYFSASEPTTIEDFVSQLKTDRPDYFKQQSGRSSGAAGMAATPATSATLEQRLKSDDPKVKQAALMERLKESV